LHDPIEKCDNKSKEAILTKNGTSIQVDECLALIIQEIWNAGVHTLESCCGHEKGDSAGYIVLDNNASDREIAIARDILKKYGRVIPLQSWYLKRV